MIISTMFLKSVLSFVTVTIGRLDMICLQMTLILCVNRPTPPNDTSFPKCYISMQVIMVRVRRIVSYSR